MKLHRYQNVRMPFIDLMVSTVQCTTMRNIYKSNVACPITFSYFQALLINKPVLIAIYLMSDCFGCSDVSDSPPTRDAGLVSDQKTTSKVIFTSEPLMSLIYKLIEVTVLKMGSIVISLCQNSSFNR
jgi:hypothetical protein